MNQTKPLKGIFRSLDGYKSTHQGTAEKLGKTRELANARTLTEARKILFGTKRGNSPLRKR